MSNILPHEGMLCFFAMNKPSGEDLQTILLYFALGIAIVSTLLGVALVALEAYVRWNVNQDFTFLGGNTLAVFVAAAFALLLGLTYILRTK
jgi:hypothetical protein